MSDLLQHSKSDYYGKMGGKETTDGWDILVSYSEEQLNNLLAKLWGSKNFFHDIAVSHDFGEDGIVMIKAYTFTLGSPKLAFGELDGKPRAYLKMGLSGTKHLQGPSGPPKNKIIPGNVCELQLAVPLASFSVKDDEFHVSLPNLRSTPKRLTEKYQDGNTVISFNRPNKDTSEHYVVFQFHNQDATWNIVPVDKKLQDPMVAELVEVTPEITNWFKNKSNVTWIEYSLAKISNKEDPTSLLLRPKSYKLVAMKGVLNVFIQTEGSGSEAGNAVNTQFGRKYDNFGFSPIPKDYTACIILSRELFLKKFLLGQIQSRLSSRLLKTNGVVEKTRSSGALLELRYATQVVVRGGSYSGGQVSFEIDGLNVDFNDHPVTIEFFDEDPYHAPKYSWKWLFEGQTDYWTMTGRGSAKNHADIHSEIPKVGAVHIPSTQ